MSADAPQPAWRSGFLFGLVAVLLLAANLWIYHGLAGPFHRNDFGHLYLGAVAIARGQNPYDARVLFRLADECGVPRLNPYVYPPFLALSLRPLAALGYDRAFWCWTALNGFLFAVAAALVPHALPALVRRWGLAVVCGTLVVIYFPLYRSFSAGQLNVVLLVIVLGAFVLLQREQLRAAGALLALGAMIKVVPGLLLGYLVLIRAWRAVAGFVCAMALLGLCTFAGVGWTHSWAYVEVLQQMAYGNSTWQELGQHFQVDRFNESWSALIYRCLTHNAVTQGWVHAPALAKGLSLLGALTLFSLAGWATLRRDGAHLSFRGYALWILASLLAPSLCWDHYFVIALPVLFCAVAVAWDGEHRWTCGLVLLASLGIAVPYSYHPADPLLAGLYGLPGLAPPENLQRGWAILFLSPKLFAALVVFGVLAAARRTGNGSNATC